MAHCGPGAQRSGQLRLQGDGAHTGVHLIMLEGPQIDRFQLTDEDIRINGMAPRQFDPEVVDAVLNVNICQQAAALRARRRCRVPGRPGGSGGVRVEHIGAAKGVAAEA